MDCNSFRDIISARFSPMPEAAYINLWAVDMQAWAVQRRDRLKLYGVLGLVRIVEDLWIDSWPAKARIASYCSVDKRRAFFHVSAFVVNAVCIILDAFDHKFRRHWGRQEVLTRAHEVIELFTKNL